MNEVFSLKRFARLFVKYTLDHYRSYLMSVAVLCGVMLLGGYFLVYMIPGVFDEDRLWPFFASILLLAGTMFTSTVFSDYGDKRKSVSSIMLPASTLEKFLVGWVYSFIVFTLMYTIVFYLVMVIILSSGRQSVFNGHFILFDDEKNGLLLMIYSILHAITIYGAVQFNKLHFIKTALAFFIGYGLLIALNTLFLSLAVSGRIYPAIPFGPLAFSKESGYYSIELSFTQLQWAIATIITVTVLFWIAAYFRLKEKKV